MYAVVTTGGKQVRVAQGQMFRVEKIEAPVGDTIELSKVNLLAKDDQLVVDPAVLASAKVVCTVMGQGRAKKIRVFKKKRRKNYTRTQGHRQHYTELKVREIVA
ncbi:MAG TPA: 50S ribosomal protein L21 [Candidatus Hydrogenedentes bacterium]|nr:50S ribosomal protein L21 [Candidatus Hydrogenedentota bacterium]HOS03073.1 50S ribosomal protein L21 [Candidatus Hydrogenedentota bacterium]